MEEAIPARTEQYTRSPKQEVETTEVEEVTQVCLVVATYR